MVCAIDPCFLQKLKKKSGVCVQKLHHKKKRKKNKNVHIFFLYIRKNKTHNITRVRHKLILSSKQLKKNDT